MKLRWMPWLWHQYACKLLWEWTTCEFPKSPYIASYVLIYLSMSQIWLCSGELWWPQVCEGAATAQGFRVPNIFLF
jgi:hypothetical protein